jgi:hypothetical protein
MMALPNTHYDGELDIHPAGKGMFVICTIGTPPSMKGRTVDVFFDPAAVASLRRWFAEEDAHLPILEGEAVEEDRQLGAG